MIVYAETRRMIRNAFAHFKDLAYNLMYFTDRSPAEERLSLLRIFIVLISGEQFYMPRTFRG